MWILLAFSQSPRIYTTLLPDMILHQLAGIVKEAAEKAAQRNSLIHPVPVRYMDAIDIDYDILEMCLEIDREKYLEKLNEPRYPKFANIRSGIHVVTYKLPHVEEAGAISCVREVIAGEGKVPFYIEYRDFLTIKIVSGEEPVYYYHIPGLHRKGDFYRFTEVRK